jgi:hypothetical protein
MVDRLPRDSKGDNERGQGELGAHHVALRLEAARRYADEQL